MKKTMADVLMAAISVRYEREFNDTGEHTLHVNHLDYQLIKMEYMPDSTIGPKLVGSFSDGALGKFGGISVIIDPDQPSLLLYP